MPTMARDWADPFLEQAREDLRAAWCIAPETSPSTFCMMLQMVFEKLAKAARARNGQPLARSHKQFSHLLTVLQRHPKGREMLQAGEHVLQFLRLLEEAHPDIAGKNPQPCPQLEYPWEDPGKGVVYYPARDLPLARRVRDPKDRIALDCLKFASAFEKNLSRFIP